MRIRFLDYQKLEFEILEKLPSSFRVVAFNFRKKNRNGPNWTLGGLQSYAVVVLRGIGIRNFARGKLGREWDFAARLKSDDGVEALAKFRSVARKDVKEVLSPCFGQCIPPRWRAGR